jgi:hypothetical protein
MPEAGFEKISRSEDALYGPRKLLLCGFPAAAQSTFATLLEMIGIQNIGLVWATADQSSRTLAALMDEPDGFGEGTASDLPRAVIVAGIAEKELHLLMSGCRKAQMQQALWATLTPTSKDWALKDLLAELDAERQALAKRGRS